MGIGETGIDAALREDDKADAHRRACELAEKLASQSASECAACGTVWENGEGREMTSETVQVKRAKRPKAGGPGGAPPLSAAVPPPPPPEPPPESDILPPDGADDDDDDGLTGFGI